MPRIGYLHLLQLVVIIVGALILCTTAQADSVSNQAAPFRVTPILPKDNDPQASYFRFRVKPDEHRTLRLKVTNHGNSTATYDVHSRISATNSNGYLDYSLDNLNRQLPTQAKQLFGSRQSQTVVLAPGATKIVKVSLHAPKKTFKGILLAGLTVKPHQKPHVTTKGTGIIATTAYAIALELYQQKTHAEVPNVTFSGAHYRLIQALPKVTLGTANKSPQLVQGKLNAVLRDATGAVAAKFKLEPLLFAPQSTFNLNLPLNNHQLSAGAYTLVGTLKTQGGSEFPFNFPIKVTPAQTKNIKRHAASFTTKPTHNWLLTGTIVGLVLIGSGVGYQLGRKLHPLRKSNHSRNQ